MKAATMAPVKKPRAAALESFQRATARGCPSSEGLFETGRVRPGDFLRRREAATAAAISPLSLSLVAAYSSPNRARRKDMYPGIGPSNCRLDPACPDQGADQISHVDQTSTAIRSPPSIALKAAIQMPALSLSALASSLVHSELCCDRPGTAREQAHSLSSELARKGFVCWALARAGARVTHGHREIK